MCGPKRKRTTIVPVVLSCARALPSHGYEQANWFSPCGYKPEVQNMGSRSSIIIFGLRNAFRGKQRQIVPRNGEGLGCRLMACVRDDDKRYYSRIVIQRRSLACAKLCAMGEIPGDLPLYCAVWPMIFATTRIQQDGTIKASSQPPTAYSVSAREITAREHAAAQGDRKYALWP